MRHFDKLAQVIAEHIRLLIEAKNALGEMPSGKFF